MPVSIKNKVWVGTLFHFMLLLLLGGVAIYYLVRMKNDEKAILEDNYESLNYCHTMQQQLDSLLLHYDRSTGNFETALLQQEKNITEPNEQKATLMLRMHFDALRKQDTAMRNISGIQQALHQIIAVNMQAIENKNKRAESTAKDALAYISFVATVVLLVAFTFTLNFPLVVTGPVQQLIEAIREIANKNYRHRIHMPNRDEFGQLADAFNEMAERLEYFESTNLEKLMFEKSRAEAVINSLSDASIGIHQNNIILFANQQALQLLGLQSLEVVGKTVRQLSAKNELFRFLIEHESTTPFKIMVDDKENYFIREVINVRHQDARSKVIVLENITSFKELDVAKTNFISTISHELKTPLASSDFSLKLLQDERTGPLSEEQKELILQVKQDNKRMLTILSELLNMSQVEAGKIQLNVQEVVPGTIIQATLATVLSSAREKEIRIEQHLEGNLPLVRADAEKTSWVLNNFLTNAIKYSPQQSTIHIRVHRQRETIIFSVTDQGPGIPQEYLPKLFQRYFKVPGSRAKGTGLGLAISKEFIEAQHGKIWVESEAGQGSAFKFSLPTV